MHEEDELTARLSRFRWSHSITARLLCASVTLMITWHRWCSLATAAAGAGIIHPSIHSSRDRIISHLSLVVASHVVSSLHPTTINNACAKQSLAGTGW